MLPGPSALDLPDLFLFHDGTRVHTAQDWLRRRQEIQSILRCLQYGQLPAVPDVLRCAILHVATLRNLDNAQLLSCRIDMDGDGAFMLRLFLPAGPGAFPGRAQW